MARQFKTKHEKICEWCSKPFTAVMSNARFCSRSCCHAAWVSENPEKVNVKAKLARQERSSEYEKICEEETCRKQFLARNVTARFCSEKCQSKSFHRVWDPKNRDRRNAQSKASAARNREKRNAQSREWVIRNPEKAREIWKRKNKRARFARYGITEEIFYEILSTQNGCCAICLEKFDHVDKIAVDHCHDSGHVRGLTHNNCNVAISWLNTPGKLRLAADYLERDSLIYALKEA